MDFPIANAQTLAESDKMLGILREYAFYNWGVVTSDSEDSWDSVVLAEIQVKPSSHRIELSHFEFKNEDIFDISFYGSYDEPVHSYRLPIYDVSEITTEVLDEAFGWALEQGVVLY